MIRESFITIDSMLGLRLKIQTCQDTRVNVYVVDGENRIIAGAMCADQPIQLKVSCVPNNGGWLIIGTTCYRIWDDGAVASVANELGLPIDGKLSPEQALTSSPS